MARILLVDDDEISLMMTEMVLSEMHYDVTTAANGKEAIALLQQSAAKIRQAIAETEV